MKYITVSRTSDHSVDDLFQQGSRLKMATVELASKRRLSAKIINQKPSESGFRPNHVMARFWFYIININEIDHLITFDFSAYFMWSTPNIVGDASASDDFLASKEPLQWIPSLSFEYLKSKDTTAE
jgi:hypothetical protein